MVTLFGNPAVEDLRKLFFVAMKQVHFWHQHYAEEDLRLTEHSINRFGQHWAYIAHATERDLIETLRNWLRHDPFFPGVQVHAEQGDVVLGDPNQINVTIWLRGISGMPACEADIRSGRRSTAAYGTTFAVALKGKGATYDDICLSGVLNLPTGELLHRTEDRLTRMFHLRGERFMPVECHPFGTIRSWDIINSESSKPTVAASFDAPLQAAGFCTRPIDSLAGSIFEVGVGRERTVSGKTGAVLASVGAFGQDNLEMPAAYHLIAGAGGVACAADGTSIGPEIIQEYARKGDSSELYVLAANEHVARDILAIANR